jgi:hypothetical protein
VWHGQETGHSASVKSKQQGRTMSRWVCIVFISVVFLLGILHERQAKAEPTAEQPLIIDTEKKEIQLYGVIYPARFNAAQGEEAHYHLLVWHKGQSPNALIETPADDLDFHAALVNLGAVSGDNLRMASWTERHDQHSPAPHEKVAGSSLDVRIAWKENPTGNSIEQVLRSSGTLDSRPQTLDTRLDWRFAGIASRLPGVFV